jgi:hypothetical protein
MKSDGSIPLASEKIDPLENSVLSELYKVGFEEKKAIYFYLYSISSTIVLNKSCNSLSSFFSFSDIVGPYF